MPTSSKWKASGGGRSTRAFLGAALLAAAGWAAAQPGASGSAATPASVAVSAPASAAGGQTGCPPQPAPAASGLSAVTVDRCRLHFSHFPLGASSPALNVMLAAPADTGLKRVEVTQSGPFSVSPAQCDFTVAGSCSLSVRFLPQNAGVEEGAVTLKDGTTAATRAVIALVGTGVERSCSALDDSRCDEGERFLFAALATLIYCVVLVAARWHKVALPTRRLLLAEIAAVEMRVQRSLAAPPPALANIAALLKQARTMPGGAWFTRIFDGVFWSRGSEVAAWGLLHEAEEQFVAFIPVEELRAGLERSSAQLRIVGGAVAPGLADRIDAELKRTVLALDDPVVALLRGVLAVLQGTDGDLRKAVADAVAAPAATPAPMQLVDRLAATLVSTPKALAAEVAAPLPPGGGTPEEFRLLLVQADSQFQAMAAGLARLQGVQAAGATPDAVRAALALVDQTVLAPGQRLAARTQAALDASSAWPLERWRALQAEALGVLYDRGDTDFATLAGWQNRVVWLVECALLLILALGTALGHETLFLLGAAGGLMSRLSRTLSRPDIMTDYGVSWSRLFLSPVVGALAGWSALLLSALMVKLGILGTLFKDLDWEAPIPPLSLGIAFLFGFSERAFDSVMSALDDKIVTRSPSAKPDAAAQLEITTSALKSGTKGQQQYADALGATGGSTPYTWSVTAGALPDGLALKGNTVAGNLAAAATTQTFTVEVRDKDGKTASRALTIKVT